MPDGTHKQNTKYDLKDDPLEKDDLADQQSERVSQLVALLNKLAENDQ